MAGCTPTGPGNPTPDLSGGGAFDLGAHLAGLMIYAMDEPEKAGALGWLIIFCVKGQQSAPLASLAKGHDAMPEGPWKAGTPAQLIQSVPVFGVASEGALLTEPAELAGVDWDSPAHELALFDAQADRLPFMIERASAYWGVIQDWYAGTVPEPGTDKVLRQYAALYNAGLYFEAYKLLEMRWMVEPEPGKELLHGLMQLAVGLHQIENGRFAMQQLEEAYGRIRAAQSAFGYPTIRRFLKRLEKATRLIKSYGPEKYQGFDLRMFPKMWFVSPWRALLGWGR